MSVRYNIRYFNLPIEQIWGWDEAETQSLKHAKPNPLVAGTTPCGLVWTTDEGSCLPISGIAGYDDSKMQALVHTINLEGGGACPGLMWIDIAECPDPSGSSPVPSGSG